MTITTAPPLSDQDVAAINQLAEESVAAVLAEDWDKWLGMFDDDVVSGLQFLAGAPSDPDAAEFCSVSIEGTDRAWEPSATSRIWWC